MRATLLPVAIHRQAVYLMPSHRRGAGFCLHWAVDMTFGASLVMFVVLPHNAHFYLALLLLQCGQRWQQDSCNRLRLV